MIRGKSREPGVFGRQYPGRLKHPGWVVVVGAVRGEPVSGALVGDFPVQQGKYREFSRIVSKSHPLRPCKGLIFLVYLVEFPKLINREINRDNRE